jgi:hypothetical protein
MDNTIDRATLKRWALAMVTEVEPEDTFVIEDNFDGLVDDWHLAQAQDEGRFVGAAEAATFAGLIVPFLLAFFGDLAKDIVKDQAKKAAGALIEKLMARRANSDEISRLRGEIEAVVARSRFSKEQKEILLAGFRELFAKVGGAV